MSENEKLDGIPISSVDSPNVVLEIMHQLKIKDVMSVNVVTGRKEQTMREIQKTMRENRITGIPIVEGKKLIGLVSTEDIIHALDSESINALVEEKMTKDVIHLQDDMPLSFAITFINKYQYGRFPVLNKDNDLVGIMTPTDVIKNLLIEMNREVLKLEKLQKPDPAAAMANYELEFISERFNFELAGKASTEIKKVLKQRNYDSKLIRRIAIACYELEINQVVHSNGGVLHCSIMPDKIIITASDTGPGIEDVNQALTEGFSTASEYVRSIGFGAGMGLANTKRVSDEFSIDSALGKGTVVRSVLLVNSDKNE